MVTTKIEIRQHLKEYVIGKFCGCSDSPVQFPDKLDLYHTIWDLMEKRPINCPVDSGNLEICLPDRREGKAPEYYNYIGERSRRIIERKVELYMWAELHDFIDDQKHNFGIEYIDSIHYFMKKYQIVSISEDAMLKNYYRWRESIRKKSRKRDYKKSKKI